MKNMTKEIKLTIAMQYRAWKKSIMKFKNVNTPLIQNPRRTECSEVTEATVHHKPKCMSCHKAIAIVLITGRAHCFYDYIYTLHQSCFLALCVFHNYIYIHHIHLASQHSVCFNETCWSPKYITNQKNQSTICYTSQFTNLHLSVKLTHLL